MLNELRKQDPIEQGCRSVEVPVAVNLTDRKSTRLNSSHAQ